MDTFDAIYQRRAIEPHIMDTFDLSGETKTLVERKKRACEPVTLAE